MFVPEHTLLTGGSGLLGRALLAVEPALLAPAHAVFDVLVPESMEAFLHEHPVTEIIHAAGFTSPPRIDRDPELAVRVNIVGTANVVLLCMRRGIKLTYVCSDYIFRGDQGNYREEDPVYPMNKYAWSKLGGECAVRLLDNALVIRTSFGPDVFPYEGAFTDQWTSREPVSTIARKIMESLRAGLCGVLHIGGPRRTVYEYARAVSPEKEIKPLKTSDVNFVVPGDTSLDTGRFHREVRLQSQSNDTGERKQ